MIHGSSATGDRATTGVSASMITAAIPMLRNENTSARHAGVRDELAHVGEAEAVAGGGAEDRELRDQALAEVEPLPGRDDDHDAQDADEDPRDLHGLEPLDAEQEPGHHRRHDRRRRVVDAREPRGDVLLRPREEQERHDAERHGEHRHVPPDLEAARQAVAPEATNRPSVSAPSTSRDQATCPGERPPRATFMKRKLEPQTMPASTNCTATERCDGTRRRRRRPWRGELAVAGGFGRHPATLAPARGAGRIRSGCRVRNPPKCGGSATVWTGQGTGCSASYARNPGLSLHQQRDEPDDDESAEQRREPQRREGRERAGVERTETRSAGDDHDEHALQPAADGVGHRGLHHRVAEDRADVVGAAGDDERERRRPR